MTGPGSFRQPSKRAREAAERFWGGRQLRLWLGEGGRVGVALSGGADSAALLWLIGYYLAIPLMVFLYLLRHRETRTILIALPFCAGTATWGIFGYFLHLPFPPGVLLEMAGLS